MSFHSTKSWIPSDKYKRGLAGCRPVDRWEQVMGVEFFFVVLLGVLIGNSHPQPRKEHTERGRVSHKDIGPTETDTPKTQKTWFSMGELIGELSFPPQVIKHRGRSDHTQRLQTDRNTCER